MKYERVITNVLAPWRENKEFLDVYNIIKKNTLVDLYRCYDLWSLVGQSKKLEGDLIEVGVWRGGTGVLIGCRDRRSKIYLCDTFKGVVKSSNHDSFYFNGEHSDATRGQVESLINKFELSNVRILEGVFPDNFMDLPIEKIKFCHIDVDVFESAKGVLDWVWSKMVLGGIVVFDDYGFIRCNGVTKYVNSIKDLKDRIFCYNLNGHGILIKIK